MDYSYRAYLLASPEGYLAGIWLSPNQIKYPNFALRIEIHNFAELWTSAITVDFGYEGTTANYCRYHLAILNIFQSLNC
jgi:hypothetical protein